MCMVLAACSLIIEKTTSTPLETRTYRQNLYSTHIEEYLYHVFEFGDLAGMPLHSATLSVLDLRGDVSASSGVVVYPEATSSADGISCLGPATCSTPRTCLSGYNLTDSLAVNGTDRLSASWLSVVYVYPSVASLCSAGEVDFYASFVLELVVNVNMTDAVSYTTSQWINQSLVTDASVQTIPINLDEWYVGAALGMASLTLTNLMGDTSGSTEYMAVYMGTQHLATVCASQLPTSHSLIQSPYLLCLSVVPRIHDRLQGGHYAMHDERRSPALHRLCSSCVHRAHVRSLQ